MQSGLPMYENWRDFFSKRLVQSGAFALSDSQKKGDIDKEVYRALTGDLWTTIEVGYFSSMTLVYVYILHPHTPGNNKRQQEEYLYKYEFHPEKQYGGPGLDFEEMNVQGINNLLIQGLHGSEKVFYKNGKPVRSELTASYYWDSSRFTRKYNFTKASFCRRLLNKIAGTGEQYHEVRIVNLRDVFSGLDS